MTTSGYRQAQRACPTCGVPLDEQLHGGVHVDVCSECAGVWIDWMDGELENVGAKIPLPSRPTSTSSGGDGGCPLCATKLDTDSIGNVSIARCGSCAGAWVSHASLVALRAGITDDDTDIESEDPFLTRLLDAITRFLLPGR